MMIFTSIYGVIDGLFVSNYVGKTAFAAINLIMPFIMGLSAIGFMIGTGGSAIVSKALGEGKKEKANEYFSMLVYTTAIGGLIFASIFFGYSIGSAPIIGYHYGAGDHAELKNLFRMSLTLIGIWGVSLLLLAETLAPALASIFVGYDAVLFSLTRRALRLYALAFLVHGFNIFGSSFFTALSNGAVSAAISFLRTLVFQVAVILVLPLLLGIDGIWLAAATADTLTFIITIVFFIKNRTRYHY